MARTRGIELVWPDKHARRPLTASDELTVIERISPPPADGPQARLPLDQPSAWRNLLVQGDNLRAMQALSERLGGRVTLIYIDPPYATGLSYYSQTEVGDGDRSLARRAYRDQNDDGMVGYLEAMYHRLSAMHELLSEEGKIFVHCDWRANSMIRLLLDEIFGPECFRNEIIWRRAPNLGRQAASKQLGRVFDSIYVYSKRPGAPFPGPVPRRRSEVPLDGKGKPKGTRWDEEKGLYFTTAPRGDYTDKSIAKLRQQGRVYDSPSGTVYIKYFLTRGEDGRWYKEQPVDALWDDFEVRPLRHRSKAEDMGYDTQKPEGLLERIIGWATAPGDLVADFYAGSGTTAAVAEKMGRRWVTTDIGGAAIETARRRLLELGPERAPFDIASVEAGERRAWARSMAEDEDARTILAAYGAEAEAQRWGRRDGVRIFVAASDRPVSDEDVAGAIDQVAPGERLLVLAFAWADRDPEALRRAAAARDVVLEMRTIPMDVVRRSSLRGGKLRFARRPELELELVPEADGPRMHVRLSELRCEQSSEGAWSELVDAWMVDFEAQGAFSPSWRSYRRKDQRDLCFETPAHAFAPGESAVHVKVITVYGDEVMQTLRVRC